MGNPDNAPKEWDMSIIPEYVHRRIKLTTRKCKRINFLTVGLQGWLTIGTRRLESSHE